MGAKITFPEKNTEFSTQLQIEGHTSPTAPQSTSSRARRPSSSSGVTWAFYGIANNKLQKIINGNRNRGYNLGIWNCRKGLINGDGEASSKISEVKSFLEKKNLHMLCLIEADFHSASSRYKRRNPLTTGDIKAKLDIPGYKILLPMTWQKHGQARILVYAREELKVKERTLGTQHSDLPMLTFEIGFGMEKKTIVNFFYREFTSGVSGLSDAQAQSERLQRMTQHWRSLAAIKKDLVCLGDANLCAKKWQEDSYYQKEQAEIVQTFLLDTASAQLVNEYTRSEFVQGGELSRSCIDHCYSNAPERISTPEVVAVGNSDHLGVVVTKFTRSPMIKPKTIMKRSYKNFDVESFLNDVINSDINKNVTAHNNIEEAAEEFERSFKSILDQHAPVKVFQMRKNYAPYLSAKTKNLISGRNAWKEVSVKFGYKSAEKIAKELGKEIKVAAVNDEKEYFKKDFGDNQDTSKAWKTAKVILGMNKNLMPTAIKNKDKNGDFELVTNPQKLADMFNQYFKSKVDKLREKTNQPPSVPPSERLQRWLEKRSSPPPPFQLKEINTHQFRKILKKMKSKRTHGIDWIDSFSLKLAGPLLEESLIHLINLSIRESRFSARWKPQMIVPLHKKNEKDILENYRPVSHLVQVGKMVEYAAYFQIVEHFSEHDLFHPNHHGSLANHSTTTAIIQLFDMWLEAAEKQELSAVCLLDQSAAYDLLCHQTLKEKLELYNFSSASSDWLMSYLGDRTQLVQVESKTSEPLRGGNHAVPQGSVLGGLLHLINSNDFPACHDVGESVVYVDDDSDTVHAKDPEVLRDLIEQEAGNSANWLQDNRLCVAGSKSKLLVIGTRRLRTSRMIRETKIVVDGKEITETPSEKLLGVVINNELTWKNHLYGDADNEGLLPQLSKRIGMMKKISKYMSKKNLKYFASGIFYSKLNYCLPVFGNVLGLEDYKVDNSRYQSFTVKDNNNLQVVQNKLNRMLLHAERNTPTEKLLNDTDSLSIQQLIVYQSAVLAYKIMNSGKPSYLAQKLRQRNEGMNLRGRLGSIGHKNKTLSISKEGFLYRATCIMNKLDDNLRNETKLERFKAGVRMWVKKNIKIKPSTRHPKLIGRKLVTPQPTPQDTPNPNDIRRFLIRQDSPQNHTLPMLRPPPPPTDRPPPPRAPSSHGIMGYFLPTNRPTNGQQSSSTTTTQRNIEARNPIENKHK